MTASTLSDNLRFLRALLTRPKSVGAIFPSSPALAEAIAGQVDPANGPVLEIGPGTGIVTQAILARGVAPGALTLIEYDEELARHNAARFAQVRVIQGDACALDRVLNGRGEMFGAIVSGVPLLNFPLVRRRAFMDGLIRRLAPGAPLVQFSYGTQAPVAAPAGFGVTRTAVIWANIPPARVWVYRKI